MLYTIIWFICFALPKPVPVTAAYPQIPLVLPGAGDLEVTGDSVMASPWGD